MSQPSTRYGFIDSLRGIAAVMVIYLHMAGHLQTHNLIGNDIEAAFLWFFKYVVDVGKVGVVVFFAISGFVIPFSLTKNPTANKYQTLQRFFISRFFRLYPAYWLSAVLGVLVVWGLWKGELPSLTTYLVNLTMLQQFVGVTNILGLYWTLQIELVFYVLCVVLFALGWLNNRKMVFAVAIAMLLGALALAAARYALNIKLPVALFLALGFMFWGCLWREWVIEGIRQARTLGLIWLGLFAVLMPPIALLAYNMDMGFNETWDRYLISYYTAAAILVACTTRFRLEGRFYSWLGQISYSVYLMHPIVIALVFVFVVPNLALPAHGYIALVILATLALSHLCHAYLEAPSIAWGRQMIQKLKD